MASRPLNILISTPTFLPDVGGLELLTAHIASHLSNLGHSVKVVTKTRGTGEQEQTPYEVVRVPSPPSLINLVNSADVHLQTQLNLTFGWPHAFSRTPLVMGHQNWTPSGGVRGLLKQRQMHLGVNVACSRAIAKSLPVDAKVVGNPYSERAFPTTPYSSPRSRDILFVGRVIADKGLADLITAIALLSARGVRCSASVVGVGGEREACERQAAAAGLSQAVEFVGALPPEATAAEMRRHRLLVVPSKWEEPFGIVALEGIASGCHVLVTDVGGLPEAVGPCGTKVPKSDPEALAAAIVKLLGPERPVIDENTRRQHLERHTVARVAQEYLSLMLSSMRSREPLPGLSPS